MRIKNVSFVHGEYAGNGVRIPLGAIRDVPDDLGHRLLYAHGEGQFEPVDPPTAPTQEEREKVKRNPRKRKTHGLPKPITKAGERT